MIDGLELGVRERERVCFKKGVLPYRRGKKEGKKKKKEKWGVWDMASRERR